MEKPVKISIRHLYKIFGDNPKAALAEIFAALKPGGILSVTEVIFDPHFQSRRTVIALASEAGFVIGQRWGHRLAYVQHLEKPAVA